MFNIKYLIKLLLISHIFLLTGHKLQAGCTVALAEGKVSVFKYSHEKDKNKIEVGSFIRFHSTNIIEVDIRKEREKAFISDEKLTRFAEKLHPGTYLVLTEATDLEDKSIKWEVKDIEVVLEEGTVYSDNKTIDMDPDAQALLINDAKINENIMLDFILKNDILKTPADKVSGNVSHNSSGFEPHTSNIYPLLPSQTGNKDQPPTDPQVIIDPPVIIENETGNFSVSFTATQTQDNFPFSFDFDASASVVDGTSQITDYSWDFGDGNDGSGITTSHTYASHGEYTVKLTITCNNGKTGFETLSINTGYYVSSTRGNDSNNGSYNSPWKTITHAMEEMDGIEASVITVENGTYNAANGESFPANPINLKDKVTLKGESLNVTIDGGGSGTLFTAANLTSFTFDTLTLQNAQIGVDSSNSNYTFKNGHCTNFIDGPGAPDTVFNLNGDTLILSNSEFDNCEHSVYGDPASAINSLTVIACDFHSHNDYCLYIHSSGGDIIISDSSFHDDWGLNIISDLVNPGTLRISRSQFYGTTADNIGSYCGIYTNFRATDISNCLFYNISYTHGLSHVIVANSSHVSVSIHNCTFADISLADYEHRAVIRGNWCGILNIQNCSFTNNTGHGICFAGQAFIDPENRAILNNNLFHNNTLSHVAFDNTDAAKTDYTVDDGGANDINVIFVNGSNNIDPDISAPAPGTPGYSDQPNNNYWPLSTSMLVDRGIDLSGSVNSDIKGNPRPHNGTYDIGCYEYNGNPSDPVISGRIYNSITGETINNAVIGIYKSNKNSPDFSQLGGYYSFNVLPGNFYLAVKKNGYYFPSTKISDINDPAKGQIFTVKNGVDQEIDIPLDPSPFLQLTKTANKKDLEIGEIVTVNCRIENKYIFETIDNVTLIDEIPQGMKFVPGSVLINGNQNSKAVTQNHILNEGEGSFNKNASIYIGSVTSKTTINISYQMVVTSGAFYGNVKGTACCYQGKDLASTQSAVEFAIIPDPLFYTGTIIGKINHKDTSSRFSLPAPSFDFNTIEIIMENGIKIKPDKKGYFHVPNVLPGRHILKLKIPYTDAFYLHPLNNPLIVDVREGGIHNVEFHLTQNDTQKTENEGLWTDDIQNQSDKSNLFITALGDIKFSKNKISGNTGFLKIDDEFKEGWKLEGKGAVFLSGEYKGYNIEGSLNSDRSKDKYKSLNKKRLLTRPEDKDHFATYGDDSKTDYTSHDTGDLLNLKIEKDGSYAKWGTIDIDLPYYRRVFQGGKLYLIEKDPNSQLNTLNTKLQMFWAGTDHKIAYEELTGVGGSVYYLKNNDIIEGSEKVVIIVREPVTRRTLETVVLSPEDYEMNYTEGRIILNKPLPSYLNSYSGNIIQSKISSGNQTVLNVTYEYLSFLPLKRDAFGGRLEHQLTKHLQLSGQYIEEEREDNPYILNTIETIYNINKDNWFKIQYGQSKEGFSNYNESHDAGLSFFSQSENSGNANKGDMITIEAKLRAGSKTNIDLLYQNQDTGFSSIGSARTSGQEKYYGGITYNPLSNLLLSLSYFDQKTENELTDTTEELIITKINFDYIFNKYDLRLEYQIEDLKNGTRGLWNHGYVNPVSKQSGGLRLGYKPNENLRLYAGGQRTIKGSANNQFFAGTQTKIFHDIWLEIENRQGTIGESTSFGISKVEKGQGTSAINYSRESEKNGIACNTVEFSKTYQLSNENKLIFVNRIRNTQGIFDSTDSVKSESKINNNFLLGAGYEKTAFEKNKNITDVLNRESAYCWYKLDYDQLNYSGKIEYREDKQYENTFIRSYYYNQKFLFDNKNGMSLSINGGIGYAKNSFTGTKKFDFTDFVSGFAFRPFNIPELNILGKYIYLTDLYPDSRENNFIEDTKTRKHIISASGTYKIFPYLELSETISRKIMKEKTGNRHWQESETYLWINGMIYSFYKDYKINIEYRIMENLTFDDKKQGFLTEILIPAGKNLYFGAGYNFTSFDDDLSNDDEYDMTGCFIRITGVY